MGEGERERKLGGESEAAMKAYLAESDPEMSNVGTKAVSL